MIAALLSGLLLMSMSGPEPNRAEKAGGLRCDIQVIHATRGKPFVDEALRPLRRYLKNSFGSRYQRFKQLEKRSLTLSQRERGSLELPNGTKLLLTYLGVEESLLRLVMEVGGLKTTVKVHDGGLFFQAGRKHKGGMLIVAIRAHAID